MTGAPVPPRFRSVDELLEAARAGLPRLTPAEAAAAAARGCLLVDIRPAWLRQAEGEIAGSVIVERNNLEWRLDPGSAARLPQARAGQEWIVICSEGYTSSLAAAALRSLGIPAADLIGGVRGWREEGLPLVDGPSRTETVSGQEQPLAPGDLGAPRARPPR
jgi:rhodanese-related sulfurtransferase